MNIAIITIHNIHNFGSVFQAYALNKYLLDCGYNAQVVDYTPPYFRKKTLRSFAGQLLNLSSYLRRKHKFEHFVNAHMSLTPQKYYDFDDLRNNPPTADVYIAGGDQLWNSYHNSGKDPAYKLLFAKGYKISYGTSMGKSQFTQAELDELKNALMDFSFVSVRESSSVDLLKNVGIRNVVQTADPVLLLDKGCYERFIQKPPIERYLLVYLVTSSEILNQSVDYIAKKLGLKVVLFAGLSKKGKCDYLLKDLGPDEVLSYIKYADFVLSASFHATLFSIMFHKEFATLLPDRNTNERIEDLLSSTGLDSRIIRHEQQLNDSLFEKVSFQQADEILEKRIAQSQEYLHKAISAKEGE